MKLLSAAFVLNWIAGKLASFQLKISHIGKTVMSEHSFVTIALFVFTTFISWLLPRPSFCCIFINPLNSDATRAFFHFLGNLPCSKKLKSLPSTDVVYWASSFKTSGWIPPGSNVLFWGCFMLHSQTSLICFFLQKLKLGTVLDFAVRATSCQMMSPCTMFTSENPLSFRPT